MASAFDAILLKLEEQKTELLSRIEDWPPEKRSLRPAPAGWSALEVVDHLVKTETAILSVAKHGLAEPHRIGMTDRLRTAFIQRIFASDRKVKVPASARQILPGAALQFEEIRARWNESRDDLVCLITRESPELLSEGIFKHPVGGWMGMQQILEFFSVHLIHHGYQINRLSASLH